MAATALGSAAFVAAWTGAAAAQPAPNFDWAGPYAGASLGIDLRNAPQFAFPDGSGYDVEFSGGAPYLPNEPSSPPGFNSWSTSPGPNAPIVATVDFGHNFQSGNFVYGWEGDASFLGTSFNQSLDEPTSRTGNYSVTSGVSTLFTFRPRVGIAMDHLLLFATGGLGFGSATLASHANIADSGKSANWDGENSAWKAGFVVGGGAEYAVTPKMRIKFEALYYNLGSMSVTATGSGVNANHSPPIPLTAQSYSGTVQLQGTLARVGVNFGF
jgi:opacity protein-like surface antigen